MPSCAAATGLLMAAVLSALPWPAQAGPGHDHSHDDAPPAAQRQRPQRQPDGSVFLPKTRAAPVGGAHPAWHGTGQHCHRQWSSPAPCVMDPNAGGKVQADTGRAPRGRRTRPASTWARPCARARCWPCGAHGGRHRALQPAGPAGRLRAPCELARRAPRAWRSWDTVPRKDIEAARERCCTSLQQRLAAWARILSAAKRWWPRSGRDLGRPTPSPGRWWMRAKCCSRWSTLRGCVVEALAFDPRCRRHCVGRRHAWPLGGQRVPLRFVGAARSLREQARCRCSLRATGGRRWPLAVGQPVRVWCSHTRKQVAGVPCPGRRGGAQRGQPDIVWVTPAPEAFVPRVVTHRAAGWRERSP
jgi:cobalt-zinc-cadmium efflux system membrane fusion protein